MAWVRIDDQAPRHEKMLKAGPAACWLWVCGIAHAQSQLTDGHISEAVLPMIGVTGANRAKKLADVLVGSGLFDKVDGGYRVHDYLDWNPSRAAVLKKRAEDNARKKPSESNGNPDGIQTESSAPRARVPSHPIPASPSPAGKSSSSPRPIYQSDRFVVFEWQLEALGQMLGPHFLDFDCHAYFDQLTQESRAQGLVIPAAKEARWEWLKSQVEAEARRRHLPIATAETRPLRSAAPAPTYRFECPHTPKHFARHECEIATLREEQAREA